MGGHNTSHPVHREWSRWLGILHLHTASHMHNNFPSNNQRHHNPFHNHTRLVLHYSWLHIGCSMGSHQIQQCHCTCRCTNLPSCTHLHHILPSTKFVEDQ